jgi:hypothetical protein
MIFVPQPMTDLLPTMTFGPISASSAMVAVGDMCAVGCIIFTSQWETRLLPNLGVDLQDLLVRLELSYASAQSFDLLDLGQKSRFLEIGF